MEDIKHFHIPEGRQELGRLFRETGDIIKVEDVARIFALSRVAAAKKLSRWTEQGWLRRVAQGKYVAVTLDVLESKIVLDDPWVLVPALFSPAYIGGRSAAEYWDLTEQVFNDIVVLTSRPIRKKSQSLHGVIFTLKHVRQGKIFGTQTIWRHVTKVQVSDVHKTIIDMLDDPTLGGGIQHVADCLCSYLKQSGRDDEKLIAYAEQLGNGAAFKRLGFLVEGNISEKQLIAQCRTRLTLGNVKLDPAITGDQKIITRWRLIAPNSWIKGKQ